MSNTAEIYKFPAKQGKQESRMAELENGYLRLANQIQDALCIIELSGREFRVLNAIVRLTYGWSKKSDRIANSLIADKTTLKVKHVSEAVLSLAYRNIIILRRIGQTRYIGINTNLDKWAYAKPNCTKCPAAFPAAEVVTWVITIPEFRDSNFTPSTIPENGDIASNGRWRTNSTEVYQSTLGSVSLTIKPWVAGLRVMYIDCDPYDNHFRQSLKK